MKIVNMRLFEDGSGIDVIDLTGADLRQLVRKAYDLSVPLGNGRLHYRLGGLSDEEVDDILESFGPHGDIHLDYLKGRAMKLSVYRTREWDADACGVTMFMPRDWFDHTERDIERLLESCMPAAIYGHDDMEQ